MVHQQDTQATDEESRVEQLADTARALGLNLPASWCKATREDWAAANQKIQAFKSQEAALNN